ncbi:hypothetical protein D5086_004849 [Populus alba]|uniref:Uncharacterized protein n=2 Tax=Populus alba TaxID=43335 RepID=A0A4U5MZD6_POPAL|nr:hypothetical protein D5086_0000287430 [Populus alba]
MEPSGQWDDDSKLKNPRNLGSKGNDMGDLGARCTDEHGTNSSDCRVDLGWESGKWKQCSSELCSSNPWSLLRLNKCSCSCQHLEFLCQYTAELDYCPDRVRCSKDPKLPIHVNIYNYFSFQASC